ncbi:MAG: hypothetical protein MRZ79_06235 [Bacteroidia bacterium]|nr:hypothetical protein [Bacteroidia bacterium]
MPTCETQLGFFILTLCNEETNMRCESCGKYACNRHMKNINGKNICVSCAAEVPRLQAYVQSYKPQFDSYDREVYTTFQRRHEASLTYWDPFEIDDYEAFVIEAELDLDGDYAGGAFFDS